MATATLPLPALAGVDRYKNRYIIAVTVSLASVLELLDTSIVNVAIPHMMGNLGATLDQIAWVSTGYVVANVIILPITGWLSAFFGRRRYFAGSIAIFVVSSFFCGNAHSLAALVFWRIIQGLGGGALLSTSQAILYEEFPREEYGTAMAIFGVGVMVGPTLGPTLGGYITDAFGWPWIFYINIPIGMLALALSLSFIQNSRFQQKAERVDYVGLLLLAAGVGTLQVMLERGERLDWFDSREVTTYAVVSALSLIAFVWHELTTEHPVVGLGLIFVPLTNLALADLPMSKIPNGTGLFNLMRQLGGSVGIAISATLVQRFTAIHRADLIANVTQYSAVARERLGAIVARLIATGTPAPLADAKALAIVDVQVTRQALMLSFEQLFLLFGACFVLSLPLLLLMHKSKGMPGGAGAGAH